MEKREKYEKVHEIIGNPVILLSIYILPLIVYKSCETILVIDILGEEEFISNAFLIWGPIIQWTTLVFFLWFLGSVVKKFELESNKEGFKTIFVWFTGKSKVPFPAPIPDLGIPTSDGLDRDEEIEKKKGQDEAFTEFRTSFGKATGLKGLFWPLNRLILTLVAVSIAFFILWNEIRYDKGPFGWYNTTISSITWGELSSEVSKFFILSENIFAYLFTFAIICLTVVFIINMAHSLMSLFNGDFELSIHDLSEREIKQISSDHGVEPAKQHPLQVEESYLRAFLSNIEPLLRFSLSISLLMTIYIHMNRKHS